MAELVMQTTPSHDEKDVRLQEDPDNAPADEAAWSSKWRAELRVIVQLAVPVMTTMATQQGMVVTDQIMVGHLGADELAAASLGNTVRRAVVAHHGFVPPLPQLNASSRGDSGWRC